MWRIYSENSSAHCASPLNEIGGEMSDTKAEGGKRGERKAKRFSLSPRDTTATRIANPTPPPLLFTNNTFHVAVKSSRGRGKSGGPSLPR